MGDVIDLNTVNELTETELKLMLHFQDLEERVERAKFPGYDETPEGYQVRPLPKGTEKFYALATLLTDRLNIEENAELQERVIAITDHMTRHHGDVMPNIIYHEGYIYLVSVVATGGGSSILRKVLFARERAFPLDFLERVERIHAPAGEYGRRDSEEDFAGLKEALGGDGYRNLANVKRRLDYKGRILWARERESGEVEQIDREHIELMTQEEFEELDPVDVIYYVQQLFGKEFYRKEVQHGIEMAYYTWTDIIFFEAIRDARNAIASFLSDIAVIDFIPEDDDQSYHFDSIKVHFGPGDRPDTYYYAIMERWRNDVYPYIEAVWKRFKEVYTQAQKINFEIPRESLEVPIRFFMTLPYATETIIETLDNLDKTLLQEVTGDFTEAVLYAQERVLVYRGDQVKEDILNELKREID